MRSGITFRKSPNKRHGMIALHLSPHLTRIALNRIGYCKYVIQQSSKACVAIQKPVFAPLTAWQRTVLRGILCAREVLGKLNEIT